MVRIERPDEAGALSKRVASHEIGKGLLFFLYTSCCVWLIFAQISSSAELLPITEARQVAQHANHRYMKLGITISDEYR